MARVSLSGSEGLSPGLLIGLLLGIVQSSLITLLPTDVTTAFWLLTALLLLDGVIYVAEYQVLSTVPYLHITISVAPAANALFNTTVFILAAQAIDGQTGEVSWQTRQVETYRVA